MRSQGLNELSTISHGSTLQTLLAAQVEGYFSQTKDLPGDRRLDAGDGKGQSASSEQNGFVVNS